MNIHNLYEPFLRYFRARRMIQFQNIFKIDGSETILDIGGSTYNWQYLSFKPKVVLLNVTRPKKLSNKDQFEFVVADATLLPFSEDYFDLVYSNSVIEHLYSKDKQIRMVDEMKKVGKSIYVQCPAKEFFFEPHLLTPFIHWFPKKIQKGLMRNFTVWGLITRPSDKYIENFLEERRLLSFKEFFQIFSDCKIIVERFLFMPKSYIAVKKDL